PFSSRTARKSSVTTREAARFRSTRRGGVPASRHHAGLGMSMPPDLRLALIEGVLPDPAQLGSYGKQDKENRRDQQRHADRSRERVNDVTARDQQGAAQVLFHHRA